MIQRPPYDSSSRFGQQLRKLGFEAEHGVRRLRLAAKAVDQAGDLQRDSPEFQQQAGCGQLMQSCQASAGSGNILHGGVPPCPVGPITNSMHGERRFYL